MVDCAQPDGRARGWRAQPTLRRESDVMGLTVCVVLLAALSTGGDHDPHTRLDVLTVVWATTVGLALTHWFAVAVSLHLVDDPAVNYRPAQMLLPQIGMAVVIATVASAVVLLTSPDFDRVGARITAAVFMGLLVAVELRVGGTPLRRAVVWGIGLMGVGIAIAAIKWAIGR